MPPRPKHIEYESLDIGDIFDENGDTGGWTHNDNDNDNDDDDDDDHDHDAGTSKHLVLVGGGHAHVQVIKALAARPSTLRVTLIDQQEAASYSGMVPGCIAKLYTADETLLQLPPLARWAGIPFVCDKVADIDVDQQLIYLENNKKQPISYDAISIDIGSATRALHTIPGAVDHTIPTRPIAELVRRIDRAENEIKEKHQNNKNANAKPLVYVLVVGAGVAGLELAMSIQGRWRDLCNLQVTVVDAVCSHTELLPSESPSCRRKLLEILQARGIQIRYECGVEKVEARHLVLGNGTAIPFDYCVWATGAAAHDLAWKLQSRGLQVDKYGWIQVNKSLQSVSHPAVFAAGDCSSHPAKPPKAGVYAVRSGPILIQNLTKFLLGNDSNAKLIEFEPQNDFLKLMACGDGTSLGFRFGIPIHGKWVWDIKDSIDNAFMDLFKVEKLPTDIEDKRKLFDVSQYDAAYACHEHSNVVDTKLAAQLLLRDDDQVNYKVNWKILRDMVCMATYREQVLEHWHTAERKMLDVVAP